MDNDTRLRMVSLEDALRSTDNIIDLFKDAVQGGLSFPGKNRSFTDTALKIMGLKKEVFETEEALKQRKVIVQATEDRDEDSRLNMDYGKLETYAKGCGLCALSKERKGVLFGSGAHENPVLMVVGFSPSEEDEESGILFSGKSGAFLDAWLRAISLSREKNVYLCNVIKCSARCRDVLPESRIVRSCFPYLKQQINLIKPRAILCLGKTSLEVLMGLRQTNIENNRGKFFFYDMMYPVICTYHPEDVLKDLSLKRAVWADLQKLARYLNLDIVRK